MTRQDGRVPADVRANPFERGFTKKAAGSGLANFGDTRVRCREPYVDGVPSFLQGEGRGVAYRSTGSATP